MSTQSMQPRACGDDAWKQWVRQSAIVLRRGLPAWLPIFSTLVLLETVLLVHYPGNGIGAVVAAASQIPLAGTGLCVSECFASGHTDFDSFFASLISDIKANGRFYIGSALTTMVVLAILSVVWVVCLPFLASIPSMPLPGTEHVAHVAGPNAHPMMVSHGWMAAASRYADIFVFMNMPPPAPMLWFLLPLRLRMKAPLRSAAQLSTLAYEKNSKSMLAMIVIFASGSTVSMAVPPLFFLFAPWWVAMQDRAYADIFGDGAAVRQVKRRGAQTSMPRQMAHANHPV